MGTKATVVAAVAGAVIGTVITAQRAGVAAPPVAAPDVVAAATEVSDLRRRVEAVESRAGQAAASATRAVESRMRSQDERIASLEATLRSVESGATGTMPARTNATEQADPAAQRAEGDAAGAKRRTADEVADDLLLKLRRTVADTSQSEATRLEALTALRRMPSGFDRGVVLALTDLFRTSTFADTRDRILRDLHNAKAPDAAADLRQLYLEGLRDADEEVRERAAEDIDTFVSEPEVRQALESVAASDPSKGVRKRAALTLEKVK